VSQVNLLPPELRQRQAIRRNTSFVIVVTLLVLALIGLFYLFQVLRLSQTQSDLADQQDRNAQLQSQIDALSQFADLQAELAAKEQLLSVIFVNEVSWSKALLDVSMVIPDASYLTDLTGQITAAVAGEAVPQPSGSTPETTLIGNMSFAGVANQTETIATWITRLEEVQGWVNAWVSNAQEHAPSSRIYTFSNGLDLTQEAATECGQGEGTACAVRIGVTTP
jgi:Tfp pilus assembly protein PilN